MEIGCTKWTNFKVLPETHVVSLLTEWCWRQKSKIQSKCRRPLGDLIISSWIFPLKNLRVLGRWCNKLHFTPGRCECLQTSSPQKKEYMVFKFNSVHTKGFVYLFLFTHCSVVYSERPLVHNAIYKIKQRDCYVDRNVFIAVLSICI